MDKYDYIDAIIRDLKGTSGTNYQEKVGEVFKIFYRDKKRKYEMPKHYGGDDKNDGWVSDDALFYQIFAPTIIKKSLKKDIQEKYSEDLEGLLKIVIIDKKWGGTIKEFIFIANTFDTNLPHDSERFFEKEANRLKKKYNTTFSFKVVNTDYIKDLLNEIDNKEILKEMSSRLRIKGTIDYNSITEKTILEVISLISGKLNDSVFHPPLKQDYKRISSPNKISINDLEEKREEIESYITHLSIVESSIQIINQDILYSNKFNRVKEAIIDKYQELSKELSGIVLYDNLVKEILKFTENHFNFEHPTKLLVNYIFDKCDIFEKEKKEQSV